MPIVFSAIASDRNIVSNFASCDGNFTEIAEQVLSKLPPCNNKMTYSHGTYLLHYIAQDDYLYFCITDKLCQRSRAFLFLNEIQRRFTTGKLTDDFTKTLAAEMYRYSEDYNTIVIRKGELDELNSIGVGCSESLLGEKILYINNPDNISYSIISHVTTTPGHKSVSEISLTLENLSASEKIEEIKTMDPKSTYTSVDSSIPKRIEVDDASTEYSTSDRPVARPLNNERISSLSPMTESKPLMSPRLYVVIIGMIILVIAMSVYALGPVSCVVVTGIGIYSLLRSYISFKDKSV